MADGSTPALFPVEPANPSDSAPSTSSMPSRRMIVGAVVYVFTTIIQLAAVRANVPIDASLQQAISVILTFVVMYFVAPTAGEVATHLNNGIVALAAAMPHDQSKVDAKTVVLK